MRVNSLQSFCFTCAWVLFNVASSSEEEGEQAPVTPPKKGAAPTTPPKGPVLLLSAQLLRPDSAEALALRLQQELEKQLPALQRGESVEVHAEELRFL
ncbi:hypothetical protein AK812_SmicGene36366 [Symbiodinium microadriaticum]|uniref:Uncharacterized protein n=1 Tax=Symbiodinium microadriaticum TaxID=2951 RepID=A0A1Q9CJ35_SYMMI|nr:hypothetical protein AK812_SmicGene36366 [Symbiodinium microadriaticum]